MKKINKKQIYFGIFWVILVTSFIFFATLLILVANGYHFNYNNFRLEKTGMVVVNGNTQPVQVTINGKSKTVNLPAKFPQLFPATYNVKIERLKYFSYQKTFQLAGGQAVVIGDVNLILQNIKESEILNDEKTVKKIKNDNVSEINQFIVRENEIWLDGKLVTRFSQTIIAAIFDSSANQFFVQLKDGIHVIQSDGSNDNLILALKDTSPLVMSISGNNLYYISGNRVFQAQIR